MIKYNNGNYQVQILRDGTKKRVIFGKPTESIVKLIPEYPESIDVKVTNKCNAGCAFCHENSVPNGSNFNVELALRLFKDLPNGVEVAIGGGNPLEVSQDLKWLARKLRDLYQTPLLNITVNSIHLAELEKDTLSYHVNAIGISYRRNLHDKIKEFIRDQKEHQVVIHLIAGVHGLDDLERCLKDFKRVLILGYKQFGRGVEYYNKGLEENLVKWRQGIGNYLDTKRILAFDNLAIDQLEVGKFFSDYNWEKIYMGNDGFFSMYLDLVKKEYAFSSTSVNRHPIGDLTIKRMFEYIRKERGA